MARVGKPQKSKKHKKLKSVGSSGRGLGGRRRDEGLNQKPKSFNQEIPRKLRDLGIAIKDVKEGRLGKKSKNKYLKKPDGPKRDDIFTIKQDSAEKKKEKDQETSNFKTEFDAGTSPRVKKVGKKKQQMTDEAVDEYISNLKPTRPLLESFSFKKKKDESQKAFMRRVNEETDRVIKKSTIDDRFDISDKKKIETLIHKKMSQKREKAKDSKPKSRKKRKAEARREKKYDEFEALKDNVTFGDVVHAPPSLSVLPKKAVAVGFDRPGLRMPELKEAFILKSSEAIPDKFEKYTKNVVREKGKTVKRKYLSAFHQKESDAVREDFISAYRQMKSKKARLKQ